MAVNFQRADGSVEQAISTGTAGPDAIAPSVLSDGPVAALLSRVRWVLVRPTHPGNIGACARALKATGHAQVWLADVSAAEAKELCSDPQAVARASGADDLLQACQADSLSAILGPTVLQVALTARPREFEPPRRTLDEALEELCNALADDPEGEVAIVFGPERSGLANEDLLRCNRVCGLEVNPSFSSLNLSQAAQIVAYLLRQAVVRRLDLPSRLPKTNGQGRPTAVAANAAGIEALHTAFTDLAIQTGYLDPKQPGRFDERLRALWARAGLQRDELQMLHGLLAAIKKQC